jgi:hypothetical protein
MKKKNMEKERIGKKRVWNSMSPKEKAIMNVKARHNMKKLTASQLFRFRREQKTPDLYFSM